MTIVTPLSYMGVNDNEGDYSLGGADESRAIIALNMAVSYFLSVAASLPKILSARGAATIATAINVESTAIPTNLLRLDKLWALDVSTLALIWPLEKVWEVGGHVPSMPWPLNVSIQNAGGQPAAYYIDGQDIYWTPKPDAVYQIRAYGLWSVAAFTARTDTFPFPDSCALPIAAFASKYLMQSVDDPIDAMQQLAVEFFTPVLRALRRRDRSGPEPRTYKHVHTT